MKIGILGSGSMGTGIAQVAATAGNEVLLCDKDPQALERAKGKLEKIMLRLVKKEKLLPDEANHILSRISYVHHIFDFRGVALVIEAIVEDLAAKKEAFQQFEKVAGPHAVFATNTSALSVAAIAAACHSSQRVLGIHFFNPAPLMKLVEIIPAVQTDREVVERVRAQIEQWGKITVVAKDTPGFIVNRIARPFYGEALRILDEGLADIATIDWAMTELGNFRMGPFTLMDYIGNDINVKVTETVFEAFFYDARYKPSFTQQRLVEAGYLGRKTGKGYYDYSEDAVSPEPNKDPELGNNILWRIVVMLINEAADALFWNIASRDDIDLAMAKGVNYPKGLLKWADEAGIQHCVDTLDRLHSEYREERYRCSPLLRKLAREGATFYP